MPSSARGLLAALALAGCTSAPRHFDAATFAASSYGDYDSYGLATWYGEEAAGARTASGERFDPAGITAAHRSLPIGSYVEVTALDSGRSIIARINDRGPGRRDRLIDLSRGAAQLLGTDRDAVARVRVRAVRPGGGLDQVRNRDRLASATTAVADRAPVPRLSSGRYVVQVASFSSGSRAAALAERIGASTALAAGRYRVRLGPFANAAVAQAARDAAAARGYGDAQVLAEDR